MHIQLWSYNYEPEPTGIGPLSTVLAQQLSARGHRVTVVAAHPHYPEPLWGSSWKAYHERRGGIDVVRLPLWPGRATTMARVRQEVSFTGALAATAPMLPTPDVMVAVSPCFPALAPAMLNAKVRRIPWILWLQDILPDAATATGLLEEGRTVGVIRRFERLAYRSSARIVVISDSFAENLRAKGASDEKMVRIYNPATITKQSQHHPESELDDPTVLTMGNIGHTQNLVAVTKAFEASAALRELGARFVMAGDGDAGDEVRAAVTTERVEVTGVLNAEVLDQRLGQAAVALVSQDYQGADFNVPSKLMNFMICGLPVIACVRKDSEVARIVRDSGAGWVTSSEDLGRAMDVLAQVLRDPRARAERGQAGRRFAFQHFSPEKFGERFERTILQSPGVARSIPRWPSERARTPIGVPADSA